MKVRSHAQTQTQPSLYHQTQSSYQPWANVATTWTQERQQRRHPPSKPRGFEFSLKVPFTDFLGPNKEATSTTKSPDLNSGLNDGSGHYSQLYRPSSVQISSAFNTDNGSTNDPNGEKTAHKEPKPTFQFSLFVPVPPSTPSPKPSSSNGGFLENLYRPGSVKFVQSSYTEPTKPQSSSSQGESASIYLNSANAVQQQTEHQIYEPDQTKYTDRTLITFSPVHANQHQNPAEQISQSEISAQQSLLFPEHSASSLQIPQNPPPQSDSVHSGFYSAPINPSSNDFGKGQSEEIDSPDLTNAHLFLSPSQYERVPHEHDSAVQVNPESNNYGQHQTWQPTGTPLTLASEQYDYGPLTQSFSQNVETAPLLHPLQPSFPTVASSQYELPSFHQVDTTNYYGAEHVVQMQPTEFSSPFAYQYSRDQSGQEALPDHLTALDPMPNSQDPLSDYQTQTWQHTGERYLVGKPNYNKLFIDVDDVTDGGDGQNNYFSVPPTHYDGYSSTQTQ